MTRAEKLEAAGGAHGCTCPHDDEGVREQAFVENYDPDGAPRRTWYYLKNPTCPLHGDTTEGSPQ